jgi:hypothetical protein
MQNCLIRFIAFLFIAFSIASCKNQVEPSQVHEEQLDTNRLVKIHLASCMEEPMEMAITNEGRVLIIERKGAKRWDFLMHYKG